jgi:hypothetical protein
MGLERLSPADVSVEAVHSLGLDPDAVKLSSAEALAASIRRAASFLSPTTPGALVRAVADALTGLPGMSGDQSKREIETVVESLVSYGDLLELPIDDVSGRRRQLFLGPPAFVRRTAGYLLLGVRPEGAPLLGEDLLDRVEYHGHVRLIPSDDSAPVHELLAAEGLAELRPEHWLRAPRRSSPQELVDTYLARLDAAGIAGEIEGVRIIDPASDVTFYRGRWRPLRPGDEGRFVARRPQAFGAELWCFAETVGGAVTKLIDLPIQSPLAHGSDEAWRLQAALDALSGHPQRARVERPPRVATALLDLFSPVPSWVQRRLDVIATLMPRSRGALFSYALPDDDVDEEMRFLESMMWFFVDNAATKAKHGQ